MEKICSDISSLAGEIDHFGQEEAFATELETTVRAAHEANSWHEAINEISEIEKEARESNVYIGRIACRAVCGLGYKPQAPELVTDIEGSWGFHAFRAALANELETGNSFKQKLSLQMGLIKNSVEQVDPLSDVDFSHVKAIANVLRYPVRIV